MNNSKSNDNKGLKTSSGSSGNDSCYDNENDNSNGNRNGQPQQPQQEEEEAARKSITILARPTTTPAVATTPKCSNIFIRTQRGDDRVDGETLTSLSECSIVASSLDSDVPSSLTLQVVSKHCTCVVLLLRAANYARSLVEEEYS